MYIKYFIETSSEKALAAQLASSPPSGVPAAGECVRPPHDIDVAGAAEGSARTVLELTAALLGAVGRLAIK